MKRFSKLKNKKGFTLLETLLATCILVIVSSMLMQGFITAMGYSYNSSVYSRSASYNSQLCITQMAEWSKRADGVASIKSDGSIDIPETRPYYLVGKVAYDQSGSFAHKKTITFGSLGTVNVAVYEQKDVNDDYDPTHYPELIHAPNMIQGTSNIGSFSSTERIKNNPNAVADNRTILFYYPTNNGNSPSDPYFGNTHVYLQNGTTYVWGYDDSSEPDGVKVLSVITNRTGQ